MSLYVAGVVGVTGVGAPLAAAIGFVALDNIQAGARSMWTNEHTPTYGGELIEWSGLLPKGYGEIAYSLVDIGLVGKAASVLKTATQTQNVIKLQATKAVKVGQTIKPTEVTISVEKISLNQKNVIELKSIKKLINIDELKKVFQKKLDNIRDLMPNIKLKTQGNMAIAKVEINGLPNEFIAHSKIHNANSKGANIANFSYARDNKIFNSYVVDKFPRYNDTEAKILEDIASKIKDPSISGKIDLYTELPSCQSCSNIILEFKQKYPNIELNVFSQ